MRRYGCTCFLGDLSPLALAMNSDVVTEHLVLGGAPSPLLEFLPGAAWASTHGCGTGDGGAPGFPLWNTLLSSVDSPRYKDGSRTGTCNNWSRGHTNAYAPCGSGGCDHLMATPTNIISRFLFVLIESNRIKYTRFVSWVPSVATWIRGAHTHTHTHAHLPFPLALQTSSR